MRLTLNIAFITLIFSSGIFGQQDSCSRISNFGLAEICLPKMENYQECYLYPTVKSIADATEISINSVLGFYLNNDIYPKRDSLGLISFDDYFKIYGTDQIRDFEANENDLISTQKVMEGNFLQKNWNELEKEVDKIGLDMEIGIPTIIKTYNLTENSFSIVMLVKYLTPDQVSFTLAMTVNGLLIKKRLIWMAYYLNYEGKSTISQLEINSNKIVSKVLQANE